MIFVYIWLLFFILKTKSSISPCFNQYSSCLICPSSHSLDQEIFLFRSYPFNFLECKPKFLDFYYKDAIILEEKFTHSTNLDNFSEAVYENLSSALIQEHLLSSFYFSGEIHFYFYGVDFFLLRKDLLYTNMELFRRSNMTITFSPLYCDVLLIIGCFSVNITNKPKLHLKTNEFYLFVSKSFIVENIIFDGNDIILQNQNDEFACYNTPAEACCSYFDLKNKSNINCIFLDIANGFNNESLGLFNMEQVSDDPSNILPSLRLENCDFQNFWLSKTYGFLNLFAFLNTANFTLVNVVFNEIFVNSYFFNILEINYNGILQNINSQKSSLLLNIKDSEFSNINNQNFLNNSLIFLNIEYFVSLVKFENCSFLNINSQNNTFIKIIILSSLSISNSLFENIKTNTFLLLKGCHIYINRSIFKEISLGNYFAYSYFSSDISNIQMSSIVFFKIISFYSIFRLLDISNSILRLSFIQIKQTSGFSFNFETSKSWIENL